MSDRYLAPPRTADSRGAIPNLGLLPLLGAVSSLGLLPNLGIVGAALFSWRVTDGLGTATFTRATSATLNEDI